MDKTQLGLVGAISSLVALPISAGAAIPGQPAVPPAQSFSDLLQPIPNAVEKLKVSDAQELAHARGAQLIQARWHHHHHHHAHYYRRWRPYYGGYAYGPYYGGGYYYRHHHHHHHHHRYW